MPAKYVRGLKCRECHHNYGTKPVHVCEMCFGPLEIDYDYEAIAREKRLKRWRRSWKVELIERENEDWHDLWPSIAQP